MSLCAKDSFIDETNLCFSNFSEFELVCIVNQELQFSDDCFWGNRLSLNVYKTSYLAFKNNNKHVSYV